MAFNLKKVLKALLYSTSEPLTIKDIQAAFSRFHDQATLPVETEADDAPPPAEPAPETPEAAPATDAAEVVAEPQDTADDELYRDVPSLITATQVREAMDQIAAELQASDDGLLLVENAAGYRIVTHPRFARWIRILRAEPPPVKLSQSSIETLAIIAYRQPVTRGEIETIRGVSAEAGINKLLERELIYVVGRADLPGRPLQYGTTDAFLEFVGVKSLDELPASDVLSSRQIDEWLKSATDGNKISDTDMGLADEQLPLEAANSETSEQSAAPAEESAPVEPIEPASESAEDSDKPASA
ncbi:MAG: SMC-Scp complex subunit ScpB [Opitutus sp.]|nr:SMC-Scp complex subunit ScpB [Opitutus sp.]